MPTSTSLHVGAAERDITPPIGTMMAGNLTPRPAEGVTDPLYVKAIVLESGDVRIAYVVCDLCVLPREIGERAVALAGERTGIPADHIVWCCTHTHSGPCTHPTLFPSSTPDTVDHVWMEAFIEQFAACVKMADDRKVPARASRARGYRFDLSHNRRVHYKDGREINTWLLNQGEDAQAVGSAGPIDPEVGLLAFESMDGTMLAVLFHFTLHANLHFGATFSGDYPAVVAARLRERYGPQVCACYLPAACGDTNAVKNYRETGNALADTIIQSLESRIPLKSTALGARKTDITVPVRDLFADDEERLQASQWWPEAQQFFRASLEDMRQREITEMVAPLAAFHIGEVAFATFPGEPFVEFGLQLKRESPFPWTYPIELGGDFLGYLITESACAAGGYESLNSSVGYIAPRGCRMMVGKQVEMLGEMADG